MAAMSSPVWDSLLGSGGAWFGSWAFGMALGSCVPG